MPFADAPTREEGEESPLLKSHAPGKGSTASLVGSDIFPPEVQDKQQNTLRKYSLLLMGFQFFLFILFGIFTQEPSKEIETDLDFATGYSMFSGVLIMMVVGFAWLMAFLSQYEFGSIGFNFMLTIFIFQWAFFTEGFFMRAAAGTLSVAEGLTINIYDLLNNLFAVAAFLISFGGVIGKLSPLQLLVMAILETFFYSLNNQLILQGQFHIVDPGGTITIHLFGAYFGLAVAWFIGKPKIDPRPSYIADEQAFLGTILLFVYWPSFVGGALTPNSSEQQRAIVNTLLALAGSASAAFSFTSFLSAEGKLRPVDIQNATLAGGVAIGAVASLSLSPVSAVITGYAAGAVSTIGFNIIQPFLLKAIGLHDTCGIHNLHGMPALMGGIASIILAAYKNADGRTSDSAIYGDYGSTQWGYQFASVVVTFFAAIVTGLMTAWLLVNMDHHVLREVDNFHDSPWWEGAVHDKKGK